MGQHAVWPWALEFHGHPGRYEAAAALNRYGSVSGETGWVLTGTQLELGWTRQPRVRLTGPPQYVALLHQMVGPGTYETRGGVRGAPTARWTVNGPGVALTLMRHCWPWLPPDFMERVPTAVEQAVLTTKLCPFADCPEVAGDLGICSWHRALAGVYGTTESHPRKDACLLCDGPAEAVEGLPRHGCVCRTCREETAARIAFVLRHQAIHKVRELVGREAILFVRKALKLAGAPSLGIRT